MKIKDMGALMLLDAIEAWQGNPNVHELTCGSDGCDHVKLEGKIVATADHINASGQEGSKVFLACPECDYTQEHVPDFIYNHYIDTNLNYKIPLGQVVEVEMSENAGDNNFFDARDGLDFEVHIGIIGMVRALVVGHSRDCDGNPLYCLSNIRVRFAGACIPEDIRGSLGETLEYKKWSNFLSTGWSEESLKVVEGKIIPLKYQSIFDLVDEMRREVEKLRE